MPEEPRNDDQPTEPTQQWGGEVEPSTQPYSSPVESDPVPFQPTIASQEPAVYPGANYSALAETESEADSADQLSSDPVPLWGETEPTTQSSGLPEVEEPVVAPVVPDAPVPVPVVPVTPTFAGPDSPAVTPSPKKSKKPLIIGIVLAALLVVLGGGSVLAYNLWYQNPEKVVTDALISAATAKSSVYVGSITNETDGIKTAIDMTIKQSGSTGSMDAKVSLNLEGKDYTVGGSAIIDQAGDLYFKVEQLKSIVDEYKKQLGSSFDASQLATIDKLIAKIEGTWIKVSSTDLKEVSDETAAAKTCVNDTVTKFKDDRAAVSEIANLYKKNQFIVIDKQLGEKDGSFGYVLTSNQTATKAFAEGLKDTKIYKALHDCDDTFTIDTSDFDTSEATSTEDGTVEIWVSRWSHQMTKMTANSKSDGSTLSAVITPTYNQPVEIKTPATATTIKQLQADIQELIESAYPTEPYDIY